MLADIDNNNRKTKWDLLVKKLLANLGFYEVWLQQCLGDDGIFLSLVKQRLKDNFVQKWNEELNQSSRAIFYRSIAISNLALIWTCLQSRNLDWR